MSQRPREVRPRSLQVRDRHLPSLPVLQDVDGVVAGAEQLEQRPQTRGDCEGGERPCPYVYCRYHLFLDVSPTTGSIKLNFPDLEVWQLEETCALDVADKGGLKLEEVGQVMNLTRERVRQLEVKAAAKLAPMLSRCVEGDDRRFRRLATDGAGDEDLDEEDEPLELEQLDEDGLEDGRGEP